MKERKEDKGGKGRRRRNRKGGINKGRVEGKIVVCEIYLD